jgi:uncharacterized protein YqeY
MTIKARITDDIKDAMRSKDQKKLSTLRLLAAAIKQIEVDERRTVDDDSTVIGVLNKLVKQRNESIAQFELAKRDDLANQEKFEIDILSVYLPEPLSEAEVEMCVVRVITLLEANKIADMGKVMAMVKSELHGRADMSKVSALIKAKLNAQS